MGRERRIKNPQFIIKNEKVKDNEYVLTKNEIFLGIPVIPRVVTVKQKLLLPSFRLQIRRNKNVFSLHKKNNIYV